MSTVTSAWLPVASWFSAAQISEIIEVDKEMVERFLGQIYEPQPGEPIAQTAFRAILFTDIEGSTELTQRLGDAGAMTVLHAHDEAVRSSVRSCHGHEVKHTGDGIMASFRSVSRAAECAIALQQSSPRSQGRSRVFASG